MIHLSAGELLRNERASDSVNGKLIESYLKEGKIVPVQITIDLLRQAMEKMKSNRYLIDGFPRNWDNIRGWESTMEDNCDVEGVLFLDCPEEILESRILGRGLTSGRSDDNIDTIRKRFSTYKESTIPIVEYYDNLKRLIRVRGDQNKNMVFDNLKVAVLPLIEREILAIQTNLLQSSSVNNWDQYSSLCDTSVSTTVKSGSEVSNSSSFLIQSYLCLIHIYIHRYISQTIDAKGLVEHQLALKKVGDLLLVPMANSKAVSVIISGQSATISRKFIITTSRPVLETRDWKIVDGQWKLLSVRIEDI